MVADGDGFLVTGGRVRIKEDEDARDLCGDLWRASVSGFVVDWTLLKTDSMLKRVSAAICRGSGIVVVYGGNVSEEEIAAETPADGVVYDDQFKACATLPVRPATAKFGSTAAPPFGRVHATLVAVPDGPHQKLLLFGGESVEPHMYHGSVYEAALFLPGEGLAADALPDLGDLGLGAPAPAPAPG